MKTLIRDHLGPRLATDGLGTKIFAYDHNKEPANGDMVQWARAILGEGPTARYVAATATHWYGSSVEVFPDGLDAVHEVDPTKPILATAGTIDGLRDRAESPASAEHQYSWLKDAFYWDKDAYDWGYWWASDADKPLHPAYSPVDRYARDVIVGLNHWYAGWIAWSIALDRDGGPTLEHFSKFIRPGARVLASTVRVGSGPAKSPTEGLLAVAARNVDGSTAIVLFNATAAEMEHAVALGNRSVDGRIPAQSLQTLVWTGAR